MVARTRNIEWPVGAASTALMDNGGAQAITISDMYTYIDGVTTEATSNRTINLTITSGVRKGAIIMMESKTNGSETTVFGTNITSATLTGSSGKTKAQAFRYNGTAFLPVGTAQQID